MEEAASIDFDPSPKLEENVSKEMKMNLFHIGGHVIRKTNVEDMEDGIYYYRTLHLSIYKADFHSRDIINRISLVSLSSK